MIHYSLLDTDKKDICVCDDYGSDDISLGPDASYCRECQSIESAMTAYLGKDGKVYKDSEIDWSA